MYLSRVPQGRHPSIRKLMVVVLFFSSLYASSAIASYDWPTGSGTSADVITSTLDEHRGTTTERFHRGVDIAETDDNPVYCRWDNMTVIYAQDHTIGLIDSSESNIYSYEHCTNTEGLEVGNTVHDE